MTETPALKPCPFCGGPAKLRMVGNEHTHQRTAHVGCGRCYYELGVGALRNTHEWAREKVIEKWNRRAPSCSAPKPDEGGSIAPDSSPLPVSDEVVEEVARRAYARFWKEDPNEAYSELNPSGKEHWRAIARAAITAYHRALKG